MQPTKHEDDEDLAPLLPADPELASLRRSKPARIGILIAILCAILGLGAALTYAVMTYHSGSTAAAAAAASAAAEKEQHHAHKHKPYYPPAAVAGMINSAEGETLVCSDLGGHKICVHWPGRDRKIDEEENRKMAQACVDDCAGRPTPQNCSSVWVMPAEPLSLCVDK